jgi:PAS domain S-box-containing protein
MSSPFVAAGDFENLLADTSDLVLDVAPDGRIVSANPAATEVCGYSWAEIVSLNVAQLVAPEFLQIVNRTISAVTASAETAVSELQLVGKSGNRIWLRAKARPVDSDSGVAVRLVGRDLTGAVEAELRVRQIEEHFRAASQASPDSVAINRLSDGLYVEVNDGFTEITGYSRAEVVGRTSLELNIWADPQERAAMAQQLVENGVVQNFEGHFRRKNGRVLIGNMSCRMVTLNGEPHNLSVTRDMTAWKLAERTLVEREASLAEAQQLSRTLMAAIEQAAEDIMITDPDGNIQYCNPSFQRITGYSGADVIGKNPRFLKSGRHDAEFYRQMWETMKAGKTWTGRFTNRRRDGSLVIEDATISPISDASGKPQGYVAVKRDVTEQLELEAKFQQAQKLESIGRLAGGVAHDFNNLLTLINGYTDFLLSGLNANDPLRSDAEEIKNAGARAASLTKQLLTFSRKQVIEPRALDLNATIRESAPMLRRLIGEDVALETHLDASLGLVMTDPDQIHQVIMNLAVNARDAMPDGGKLDIHTMNVELGANAASVYPDAKPGRYVKTMVTDTGIGMDDHTREHIFEPFFTTKEPGKGTGLGLSTVYGIVRQSGGWIDVRSVVGVGTSFKIYLPRVEGVAPAAAGGSKAGTEGGFETVLVVEDQQPVRAFVKAALNRYGYRVIEAADGNEAIAVANRHSGQIHLLLTDVVLPGMNGKEMSDRLTALRPGLKVLFMSGYARDVIGHRGVLDPDVAFLHKPFGPDELATKIREVLADSV